MQPKNAGNKQPLSDDWASVSVRGDDVVWMKVDYVRDSDGAMLARKK